MRGGANVESIVGNLVEHLAQIKDITVVVTWEGGAVQASYNDGPVSQKLLHIKTLDIAITEAMFEAEE